MAHFYATKDGLLANETPAQRLQRRLAQDEIDRPRAAPTLPWMAEVDGFRAVGGDEFDARIYQ